MDIDGLIEELDDEFGSLGIDGIKKAVLRKAAYLCKRYGRTAEFFVEAWVSYAASNGGVEPNEDTLDKFEASDLLKKEGTKESIIADEILVTSEPAVKIYGGSMLVDSDNEEGVSQEDDIFSVYGGGGEGGNSSVGIFKKEKKLNSHLNDTPTSKKFSPAGFSAATQSPSMSYSARSKAGDSVLHYKCKTSDYWNEIPGKDASVEVKPVEATQSQLDSKEAFKYMFQKTTDVSTTLNSALCKVGYGMVNDEEVGLQDLRESLFSEGLYLGKILSSEGKLTLGGIYFEGDSDISGGHIVPLDLSKVEEYRLFSGQIVLVKGINELGKCLRASEIVVPPALPKPKICSSTSRPLNLIVACGPYTPTDSLIYEALMDLIEVIKKDKPDICILMGPFIDPSHPLIGELCVTFEDLFESLIKQLMDSIKDLKTRIVLVPSFKDVHHHIVYPTPKFNLKNVYEKLTLLPDPAIIEVEGITIGLTSTDILLHLSGNEIAKSTVSDRMGGLSKHILSQRNFYPLYPPDENVPLDVLLWYKYSYFHQTPHVLIAPSDLRHFIKDVEGTVVVNPERLTKFKSGGTYARLQVKLPESFEGDSVADFCCGEIKKI